MDEAGCATEGMEEVDEPGIMTVKRVLDEDKQNLLFEILRCAVCLEIPKGKHIQVRTCEKGHHFCSHCHKKLRSCAICRGRLFSGRNFVVEELITKLGPDLGILRNCLPSPAQAPNYCPGKFPCLHQCKNELPAGHMLPHIRKVHPDQLVDNKRSNPYNGRFDWMFDFDLGCNKIYSHSMKISDMGLFTLICKSSDMEYKSWIQMLTDETIASSYRYKITFKTFSLNNVSYEFGINCKMLNYRVTENEIPHDGILCIDSQKLKGVLSSGDTVKVIISIWKFKKEEDKDFPVSVLVPDESMVFMNDRKLRRNRNRNKRRRWCKEKMKIVNKMEQISDELERIFVSRNTK